MRPRPEPRGRASLEQSRLRRKEAERRGRLAEALCLWHLRLRLWRVLARNWRTPVGEIDLIARRGGVLAFIEVKRRADAEDAIAAVSPRQRRRVTRAAQAFLARRPELAALQPRFDLMLLSRRRPPRHLRDAWRADD